MKHFYRIFLAATIAAVLLTTTAWDKVNENENLNIGIPGPTIILSGPPDFIMPSPLGFYVAVDIPFDLYQISNICIITLRGEIRDFRVLGERGTFSKIPIPTNDVSNCFPSGGMQEA